MALLYYLVRIRGILPLAAVAGLTFGKGRLWMPFNLIRVSADIIDHVPCSMTTTCLTAFRFKLFRDNFAGFAQRRIK